MNGDSETDKRRKLEIELKGQCPDYVGHCCEGSMFIGGMLLATIIWMVITMGIVSTWQSWSVAVGVAHYDQATGRLIYKDIK